MQKRTVQITILITGYSGSRIARRGIYWSKIWRNEVIKWWATTKCQGAEGKAIQIWERGPRSSIRLQYRTTGNLWKYPRWHYEDETTKVKRQLEKMVTKINYWNKLIKIADRLPYGCTTVSEYEKDRLANNGKDEKRVKESENWAEKIEKEKIAIPSVEG